MRSLLQRACILLTAIPSTITASSIVHQKRTDSKIDEFNSTDCTTIYPNGYTDDTPTWHHSPPIDECIGIDQSTVSVRVVTGTGEAHAWGYYVPGACGNLCGSNITFDTSIDGGSSCHPVVRDGNNRVHDIQFPAVGATNKNAGC